MPGKALLMVSDPVCAVRTSKLKWSEIEDPPTDSGGRKVNMRQPRPTVLIPPECPDSP